MPTEIEDNDLLWVAYPQRKARQWLVLKLRAHFPPDQIEIKVRRATEIIKLPETKEVFLPERELTTNGVSRGWSDASDTELRAEILYGLLGTHPEFFDHIPYLYFIARRRYRAVTRMLKFVNPNFEEGLDGPVFVYPSGNSVASYELNSASDEYWELKDGKYPFVLSAKGKTEPKEAIERIFHPYPDELDSDAEGYSPDADHRNMLGCEAVAVAVHLDSLLAAKSPDQLLTAMVARGPDYLRIDHPLGAIIYAADGTPGVIGAVTVSRDTAMGDVWLPIEFELDNPLAAFVQLPKMNPVRNPVRTVAGLGAKLLDLSRPPFPPGTVRLRIEDGIAPLTSAPPDNIVTITGIYVDPATLSPGDAVAANTRYTGVLEVQLLPRDIFAGTRLTEIGAPVSHFLTDPRRKDKPTDPPLEQAPLFERVFVSRDDLIPGDHVILPNHPAYQSILVDDWQAEHSFVTRVFTPHGDLETAGHGLSGKLAEVASELFRELNRHFSLIAEVTRRHTASPAGIGRSGQNAAASEFFYFPFKFIEQGSKERPVKVHAVQQITHGTGKVVEYDLDKPEKAALFAAESDPTNLAARRPRALTVLQPAGAPRFAFWYKGKPQIIFRLANESNDLPNWKIAYVDPKFVLERNRSLFKYDELFDTAFVNWVEYKDLKNLFPIYDDPTVNRIPVIRPRVEFTAKYQAFLQQVGAL